MEKIALDKRFLPLIQSGQKTTTIRYGKRDYKIGPCMFYYDVFNIWVNINKIEYKQFEELTNEDAITDGFTCLDELKDTLKIFYPNIEDKDIITKVTFKY